ncbi:MAG: zf-HC2 domain-containing protein [Gemmatimonadaceae bacterium]
MTITDMTCEAFDAALPDHLEGTLDGARRASVGRHLRECVRCASLVRDIDNIRTEAAALPELVPSRDLWQGIEARIAAPVIPLAARPERQKRFAPAWMGVAAAALMISTAGVTYMLTARSLKPGASTTVAQVTPAQGEKATTEPDDTGSIPTSVATNAGGSPDVATQRGRTVSRGTNETSARQPGSASFVSRTEQMERAHSDLVYGKEIEMLENIVSRREVQLDSATVAIIKKNLQIIDAAIEQSRAALARDPASRLLGDQLTHALDKKVELLRTAALLPTSA